MKVIEAIVVLLLSFMCVVSMVEQPLQCYVGTLPNPNLKNCISDKRNIQERVKGMRERRQLEGQNNASLPVNNGSLSHKGELDGFASNVVSYGEGSSSRRRSNSCFVFFPHLNTSANANKSEETAAAHFGCDTEGICEENYKYMSNKRENVTYEGQLGELLCCRGSKCNLNDSAFPTLLALPNRPLRCSAGANVKEAILCTNNTLACFNQTLAVSNSTVVEHGCDLRFLCTGRSGNCSTFVDESGRRIELCCCFTNDCNAPPTEKNVLVDDDNGAAQPLGFSAFNKIKWLTYGWMIITLLTLSVAAIVLVVRWRRNRMYSDISVISDPRYQRLTANFTAGDTDDVKMLLAD